MVSNVSSLENHNLCDLFGNSIEKLLVEKCKKIVSYNLINKKFPNQPVENYFGYREYKRHIIDETIYPANVNIITTHNKFINKKATQLLFRLNEGGGRALYLIGVEDNGIAYGISKPELTTTLINFINMTNIINGSFIRSLKIYKTSTPDKFICTIRVVMENNLDTIAII